jgi:hypothetical protein
MTATAMSDLASLLKQMYPYGLESILYEDCVLAGLLNKKNDFVGEAINIPVKYGPGHKVSADFAEAQTNTATSRREKFLLTTSFPLYGIVQISRQAIKRCRDAGAIKSVVQDESDSVLYGMRMQLASMLYGNGTAAIGTIASGGTTASLTLTNADDVVNFEVGMRIQGSTAGVLTANSTQTITDINRITGVLTLDAGDAGLANGDTISVQGNAATGVASGLGSWVPSADPSATTFRGVDRTSDVVRLSGVRLTATALGDATIGRALTRLANTVGKFGGKPDTVMLGSRAFLQFVNELEDKSMIQKQAKNSDGTEAKVGYRGIEVVCGKHRVTVFEDHYCPSTVAWCLTLNTWDVHAVPGGWPGLIDMDGNSNLRMPTSDAFEWRYVADWDLSCCAPGHNGRMDLSAILAA